MRVPVMLLLLACAGPADDTGTSPAAAVESCACWPVCAGLPLVEETAGWLTDAELVVETGSTWCRCDGRAGTVWIPVTVE